MIDAAPGREGRPGSAPGEAASALAAPTPGRASHPLLGLFPLAVMTLASFLVAFTLMMARLTSGADPALRRAASAAVVLAAGGRAAVVTRTSSGAPAARSTAALAGAQSGTGAIPAVLTRASGAGAGRVSDE